jgi:flagellar assembly factor FliW
MPTIRIQGTDLPYDEAAIITFAEGLIGLPQLRRMVLISQEGLAPFLWLASLDDPEVTFLVVEPREIFPDYAPGIPAAMRGQLGAGAEERVLLLSITLIAAELAQSTVNLRAPIVVAASTMRGTQIVLNDSPYRLDEPLARALAA